MCAVSRGCRSSQSIAGARSSAAWRCRTYGYPTGLPAGTTRSEPAVRALETRGCFETPAARPVGVQYTPKAAGWSFQRTPFPNDSLGPVNRRAPASRCPGSGCRPSTVRSSCQTGRLRRLGWPCIQALCTAVAKTAGAIMPGMPSGRRCKSETHPVLSNPVGLGSFKRGGIVCFLLFRS